GLAVGGTRADEVGDARGEEPVGFRHAAGPGAHDVVIGSVVGRRNSRMASLSAAAEALLRNAGACRRWSMSETTWSSWLIRCTRGRVSTGVSACGAASGPPLVPLWSSRAQAR